MRKVMAILLALCLMAPPSGAADKAAETLVTQKMVLENGLTVLITEMPGSTTAAVYGFVKTGSATEGKYLGTGISHFLEHMLFKGTAKRGIAEIPQEVQAMGGEINASTSFDYTVYTLTVPQEHFAKGLDIIADMLMNAKFDQQEIDKEREVVYSEMRLYKDNPDRYQGELVFDTVYKQHPYRIPIIGYEELLRPLKRQDFVDYYQTHYTPNNIVLSIAGNVKRSEILPLIQETFKNFKRQVYVLRNLPSEPDQLSARYYEEAYPTELTRGSMAYRSVGLLEPDLFATDVLAMLLGQGESSRLYREVFLKKGLVRSISASNFTPLDKGLFEISFVLNRDNLAEVESAVKAEIKKIVDKGVTDAELEKAKRQILAMHVMGRLTPDAVAYNAAADEAFTGDYEFSEKYVEAVKRVTSEDIKRVAAKYLTETGLSVVVLKPRAQAQMAAAQAIEPKEPEIQKFKLDNGLTVLLRENHAFKTVAIDLVLNGGTSQETPENNGISNLLSQVWDKGTKSRSAEKIAESVESRGMSFAPFSGRNSFGVTANVLSDDTDFALDLLEDVVKNPLFSEQELAVEKEKVRTILTAEQDQINVVTGKSLRENLFLQHPFRLNPNGTLETIEKISRQDIQEFYKRLAVPGNMVLAVYGDIDSSQMLEKIKKRFGNLSSAPLDIAKFREAPPDKTREQTLNMDKDQAMVMFGFQGVEINHPDRIGIQVMTSILGSSFSGRIFNEVREQWGQAYTLGGSFTPARDTGVISFYVLTTEQNVDAVKKLLTKIFNEIKQNEVPEKELQNMKTYLKGSFMMDLQTDASLGFTTALDELYGTGYDYYRSFNAKVDAVTAQDIKRLANQYLDIQKAAIVVTRPGNLKKD